MQDIKDLIFDFCSVPTVSGIEQKYADILFFNNTFDKTETDNVGNRYFYKLCGHENAKLLLIDAHFDEIGLMVSEILTDGFIKVVSVGSVDMRVIPSERFTVWGKEPIYAVASSIPPHLRSASDGNRLTDVSELLIDTGLSDDIINDYIRIGDRVSFEKSHGELKNNRIYGQGFDNKAAAAVAYRTLSMVESGSLVFDVCLLLSTGEEIGRLGARAAVARLHPDACITLDGGFAEFAELKSDRTLPLGGGVGISYSSALNRRFTDKIISIAKDNNIRFNVITENPSTGTNADVIEYYEGVPSALISLPLANMHTPSEIISISDAKELADLIVSAVTDKTLLGGEDDE